MSNTKRATGGGDKQPPEDTPDVTAPAAADVDPRDAEIAELEAQLEALLNPPEPDPKDARLAELRARLSEASTPASTSDDPVRDRTLGILREQRAELVSTPEGENAELRKALKALQAQVDAMQSGVNLVPVGSSDEPDPILYAASLSCGDMITTQHPHATHHYCGDTHGTVQIKSHWLLSPEMRTEAQRAAALA